MLYIYKGNVNVIQTDSVVDYIPVDPVTIYLDDILIGSFNNESSDINYLIFYVQADGLPSLENKEYKIKYVYHSEIIKEELCMVKDLIIKPTIINYNKEKTVKFYE